MKNVIASLTLVLVSFTVNAGEQNDITLMRALENAGASTEVSMGRMYVGVSDVWCYRENSYSSYTCEMTDHGIEAEGKKIVVKGELADSLLAEVQSKDAPFDPWGKFEFGLFGITCHQSLLELLDIELGETAVCTIYSPKED